MTTTAFLKGLAHAAVAGALNGLAGVLVAPATFDIVTAAGFKHVLSLALVGAAIGAYLYFKASPLAVAPAASK